MKKILIIITKGETGGAQQSVFNLAKNLSLLGAQVTVGFGEGEFLSTKLKTAGIASVRFEKLKRNYNPLTNILFAWELKKFLTTHPQDVVHFNSSNTLWGAIGAKMIKNPPLTVFTFRGMSILDKNYTNIKIFKFIYKKIFQLLLKNIDKQVFVSQENEDYTKQIGIAKNYTTIYNGLPLDINFFDKQQAREYLSRKINTTLQPDDLVIGSVGRLAYQKNYEFLIANAPRLKQINAKIKIIIIGDGPKRSEHEEQIKNLGLTDTIKFTGDIPDAYQYLKAFDIFVLPSRYEGMSITLIEAMIAGLPIVTTAVGGAKEMIQDAGVIYPLDDTKEFMDGITRLINDPKYREQLSGAIKIRAQEFDIKKTTQKYLNIFEK